MKAALLPARAPADPRERHALSSWLFLRALGLTSLAAFVSLHVQVIGLFGERGLLPLGARLEEASGEWGSALWVSAPSLFLWIGAGDGALHAMCVVGELASLALMLGALSGPAAVIAYLAYQSFVAVGTPFLPLQWDTLLLEALLLAACVAPWRVAFVPASRAREPSPLARWAVWLLVARLMFTSGVVKLSSGDPHWHALDALEYHFWTQPLPNPLSPLAHALPGWALSIGVLIMLVIEIGFPLLVPLGRVGRRAAAAGFTGLMLGIGLTGNYGFFQLLTVSMCIALLDDAAIARLVPRGLLRWVERRGDDEPSARARAAPTVVAALLASLAVIELVSSLGGGVWIPRPLRAASDALSPLHLASSYGLFAVMTTERPTIVIEESADGRAWHERPYRYAPVDVDGALPLAGAHMPRLDWMLWFAALGEWRDTPWVFEVHRALLEGRSEVGALLGESALGDERPVAVRAVLYRYRFSTRGDVTWERERVGAFGPTLSH